MINIDEAKIHKKGNSIVYNMDCVEGMKQFPDNFFDLAVVDPPYGIDADVKNSTNKKTIQSKRSL